MRSRCIVFFLLVPVLALPVHGASGQAARVLVNQHELRVEFPRDTAHAWGWPGATGQRGERRYAWRVEVEAMDGPRSFWLDVASDGAAARDFPSLEALVAAGRLWLCESSPRSSCSSRTTASASVDHGRVVLRLRDAPAIAVLFGLRPATVRVRQETPSDQGRATWATAAVTYTSPQIPTPNAARVAEANRARASYGAPQWAWRAVRGGPRRGDTLSLMPGDNATLHIEEGKCHYDVCVVIINLAPGGSWTVGDTSIVTFAFAPPDSTPLGADPRGTKRILTALRAGRTTLRVKLPVTVRENIGNADPANTTIELPVVVVP